ncbi:Fic family protein [Actinocrispum wychmicini]|uniref:Fic family protein n=1 Tax=Actinocrispum wychmicini TaxID=1213861 RepID=A0A4R2JJK6_9PSEU|nr:Fic family protein [Actinocrispum wychmicini]TCO58672.1 Fic family protein [Actinocrispum wychmicini]
MLFAAPELDATDRAVLDLIEDQHRRLRPLVAAPRRWSGLLRKVALARAVRGSNAIEGFTVTVDDAFAILDNQEPHEAGELAWRAVRGYRDAMTYVLQLAQEPRLDICTHTLRALHFMMQQYDLTKWPGRWRPDDVHVPGLIDELVAAVNGSGTTPVLVRAAMAHLDLVAIQPFKEGNERMARCLQTLVLAGGGRFAAPEFASIEEDLGRNDQEYRHVLALVTGGLWDPGRDTRPWIRFCLTAHYRQALRIVYRAEHVSRLWVCAEEEISRAGLPDRCVQPLVYCMSGRQLRNSTYRQLTEGVSQNVAGRDLVDLVRADLLDARGEKRGRYYAPSPRMRLAAVASAELSVEGNPYEMTPT